MRPTTGLTGSGCRSLQSSGSPSPVREAVVAPPARHPRTRFLRPFTTHVVNPVTRLVAGRLPGFAIVTHRGRRSGQVHRTPMNVFRDGNDWIFALTYGSDVHWVQNVLAAGEAEIEVGGRIVRLVEPSLFVDERRRLMPQPVRFFLGLMRVTEFLRMRPAKLVSATSADSVG